MNSRGSMLRFATLIGLLTTSLALSAEEPTYRAAIWQADVPGGDPDLVQLVADQVKGAGYEVEFLDSVALTNTATLHTNRFDLLALPNARILPVESAVAIEGFLKQGGDLLALGLPGWEEPRFRLGGRWLSRESYEQTLTAVRPEKRLVNFAPGEAARWKRHTNDPQSPARREIVSDADAPALHVQIDNLTSWDIVEPPALARKFAPGETLTCFRAKGGLRTPQLALEWIEADGSRWIASVNLTTNWQHYALPPEAFKAWEPKGGRGGPGDQLNVTNVVRFTVGVALSHNAAELGPHEFWLANLGPAANPFGDDAPPVNPRIPRLESFSPGYMCYPISTNAQLIRLGPFGDAALLEDDESAELQTLGLPVGGEVAMHPRPKAHGFLQDRPWRWDPLLAYETTSTSRIGTASRGNAVAVLIVQLGDPFRGGVWALFTSATKEFFQHLITRNTLRNTLVRMRRGLFLVEAGSEFHTLPPGRKVRTGAVIANFGKHAATNLVLEMRAHPIMSANWPEQRLDVYVPASSVQSLACSLDLHSAFDGFALPASASADTPPDNDWLPILLRSAFIAAELRERNVERNLWKDGLIDCVGGFVSRWGESPHPQFIQARDGGFWLEGKPWKAHGVNYMPSSGIGIAGDYFEHWLDRGAYDPQVIQRDLERIKDMGLNAVSIFIYHRSVASGHLLDFLWRCEHLGLKVNLSLRPGTPMDFRWAEMKEIIEHYRLAENDTVFAYDLAWEPSHFDENYQRKHYTLPWNAWVSKRYGSVTAAQTAWGADKPDATWWSDIASAEAKSGGAAGGNSAIRIPRSEFVTRDGPWRAMVTDYRLFLDELLAEKYAEACRLVKSIDPNHAVSFRMQFAGDPTFNQPGLLPYDLHGLRNAVDIWEPEAYGRIGAWAQVRGGLFTAAYARLCDPAKPVMWAEMGFDCWDRQRMAPSPQKLEFTARYYSDFYRMLIESGADGVFFWWYAGGYRLNEQSDYGIINPDGTDRPVTKVIREWGAKFLAAPKPPAPKRWIGVNRDLDARGLPGIYDAVQTEYWRAIEAGENVGLRWDREPAGAPAPLTPSPATR